ncbi:uncharacterized protein LOC129594686 [Paramacrobiotus metropolitanus]|uniref:uncharacterized protein LOC129594686 n=1 Tax=Paramacrobiotus metropolitanus TaxID=2943436 RepID=UPI0024457BDC|nr:uncharacterized protein LOC129594686 [Paramacrobiotus metropolitanus]
MTEKQTYIAVGLTILLVIAQGQLYAQQSLPSSSIKGCGIPIAVNTVPIPDASRFAGRWYKYRQSNVNTTNQLLDHTPLNRTGLSFSTTSATGMVIRIEQYNNPNDTACVHRISVGLFGVNGQIPTKSFSSSDNFNPATTDFNLLYLDIDSFYVTYLCRGANYKTGMCDRPGFHVITRQRPDQMTADQLKAIDDIVDSILAPFCFSAVDVQQQMFTDSKPFCTPVDFSATGCAQSYIMAEMNEINNVSSN